MNNRDIKLKVPEVYLPLFENDVPENILLWGGRGAGRSYTAAYYVLLFCMTCQPDETFFVGRLYKDDIEKTVYRQIRICAQDLGIRFLEDSKDRILLDGGCEIRFDSFKDELNLRSSPKTVGLWYEEAQQADNLITLMNLRATARRVKGKFKFIASMNRTKPNDAMWTLFARLAPEKKKTFYACVWDNPFADGNVLAEWEEAKNQLKNGDMTEDEYNLVWRGLPAMDGENTFYKWRFLEQALSIGGVEINDELVIGHVAGVDLAYGGADFCVYTELEVFSDLKRRVVRTETWKPISNADTAGRITQFCREGQVLRVGIDAGDGGGKGIWQDVSANFPFNEQNFFENQCKVIRYVPGVPLKNAVIGGFMAANKRAYDHLALRNDLELNRVFALPVRYVDVMANIWKTSTRDGKFYIESKAENKKHTGKSPDENDSMVIANTMANELLQEYEKTGANPFLVKNVLKNAFGSGKIMTKGKKGLPKWL